MKHEIITIMASLLCGLSIFPSPAQAKYGGGSGEPDNPYLIYTAEQMNAIGADSNDWDKHFKLMADIDLAGFTGISFNIIENFAGVFDGNGHSISNFSYTSTDKDNIGLFGYIDDPNAEIKDLVLIDPDVDVGSGYCVGSLVGWLFEGKVTNCYVDGGSVIGYSDVGGLLGWNREGTITNCCSTGSVSGYYYVGGLVGLNSGNISNCSSTGDANGEYYVGGLVGYHSVGRVSNCYSKGNVTGVGDRTGGLIGDNEYYGSVSNCFSNSDVSGAWSVGGLVGKNGYASSISNCFSKGSVSGGQYIGGLVGYNEHGSASNCYSTGDVTRIGSRIGGLVGRNYYDSIVLNCFWDTDTQTHGVTESIGLNEGTADNVSALTTTQMHKRNTFTEAGWDFIYEQGNGTTETWQMPSDGGYPILSSFNIDIPKPLAGSGTVTDPYLIGDANELGMVSWYSERCHFILKRDIDLSGIKWSVAVVPIFAGYFNGDGHRLLNMQISGGSYLGLFGNLKSGGQVKNLCLEDISVTGTGDYVGGIVGRNFSGSLSNSYSTGDVNGTSYVGGLVGRNSEHGSISNCYFTGDVKGNLYVGGLVGRNSDYSDISNCFSTSDVNGEYYVGGLVGDNAGKYLGVGNWSYPSVSNCYSTGGVFGDNAVGGLAGGNLGSVSNCYSSCSVSGNQSIGGLVGQNGRYTCQILGCWWVFGMIVNSYSSGSVSGEYDVGGLAGDKGGQGEGVMYSFWDIETSGQETSDGGMGLPTDQMQMANTFINAGWDFNTPVWTIDEGVDYPRLWWELVPVLHAEPELTLGTSNTISWDIVPGAMEYYAECAEDANFISIVYSTGWITETSCEFTGLELGKRYWYSVKARNSAGIESLWSNVESSLQCSLSDAVETLLKPESLKNKNMKNALLNKINEAQEMIDEGLYEDALNKLQNDILQKTDGCAETGRPDKNDWIITCEAQDIIYPLIIETIEHLKGLME